MKRIIEIEAEIYRRELGRVIDARQWFDLEENQTNAITLEAPATIINWLNCDLSASLVDRDSDTVWDLTYYARALVPLILRCKQPVKFLYISKPNTKRAYTHATFAIPALGKSKAFILYLPVTYVLGKYKQRVMDAAKEFGNILSL